MLSALPDMHSTSLSLAKRYLSFGLKFRHHLLWDFRKYFLLNPTAPVKVIIFCSLFCLSQLNYKIVEDKGYVLLIMCP